MKKLKALHQLVYGEGKTAQPGDLIDVTRRNFPGGLDEVQRLLDLGAVAAADEAAEAPPAE